MGLGGARRWLDQKVVGQRLLNGRGRWRPLDGMTVRQWLHGLVLKKNLIDRAGEPSMPQVPEGQDAKNDQADQESTPVQGAPPPPPAGGPPGWDAAAPASSGQSPAPKAP